MRLSSTSVIPGSGRFAALRRLRAGFIFIDLLPQFLAASRTAASVPAQCSSEQGHLSPLLCVLLHESAEDVRGRLVLVIALLVPLWSVSAEDRWVLLGSRDIELSASEASIDLDAAHPVKQLRLVARKSGITLSKVVVSYRDGRTHTEERRINLLVGERTKPIDPRAEAGFVERVALIVDRSAEGRRGCEAGSVGSRHQKGGYHRRSSGTNTGRLGRPVRMQPRG